MKAQMLRELAKKGNAGQSHTPSSLYISGGYCEYYWSPASWMMTASEYEQVVSLSKRYHRFVSYATEVAPQWEEVDRIYWADGSVDVIEESKVTGVRRTVHDTPPSGDRCF